MKSGKDGFFKKGEEREQEILEDHKKLIEYQKQQDKIIEKLKEDIIDDFRGWVETTMGDMKDTLGLTEMAMENFERKINELIKTIQNGNTKN